MALPTARQAIVSAVPFLVIILSYAWYRQKQDKKGKPTSQEERKKSGVPEQTRCITLEDPSIIKAQVQETSEPPGGGGGKLGLIGEPVLIADSISLSESARLAEPILLAELLAKPVSLAEPISLAESLVEPVSLAESVSLGEQVLAGVGGGPVLVDMAKKKAAASVNQSQEIGVKEEKKIEASEEVSVMVEKVASLQIKPDSEVKQDGGMEEAANSQLEAAQGGAESADAEVVQHLSTGNEAVPGEYDSANHSPADMMLASPSLSNYSDANSEGSSDSGKGGSDIQTSSLDSELRTTTPPFPEAETEAGKTEAEATTCPESYTPMIYEFIFPQSLVGKLIGRHGCFVNQIKAKTQATILVKRYPETTKLKVVAVEGTHREIEAALEMIRSKFPAKRFPGVSLDAVNISPPICPVNLSPESVRLVEGVGNDVMLTSVVSAGHFFLQQPMHPTYPNLGRLDACMNSCYSQSHTPELPRPVTAGVMCAAPLTERGWFRAEVVGYVTETDECDVRFVDYGGYVRLAAGQLRQIRSDFINLPFQCCECYLHGVLPSNESEGWSAEANTMLEELCQGQVLQAFVMGYSIDGRPMLQLYSADGSNSTCINKELVDRGVAKLVEAVQ